MIGWITVGIFRMVTGLLFETILPPEAKLLVGAFATYNVLELVLVIVSLLFNQHYIYPFAGFSCCSGGPESSNTPKKMSGSRFSITSHASAGTAVTCTSTTMGMSPATSEASGTSSLEGGASDKQFERW
eukprot:TRINITY_DN1204_c0_g1_i1.p2 TRINITY_DN1204_c0_g1~~TRINITY_DN1204_c0_g1_i1.p2  ORF type:complete len:129 (-),score=11.75 TRINITY_DN1204_c0_g1_i1:266-652(-)